MATEFVKVQHDGVDVRATVARSALAMLPGWTVVDDDQDTPRRTTSRRAAARTTEDRTEES